MRFLTALAAVAVALFAAACSGGHAVSFKAGCAQFDAHPAAGAVTISAAARKDPSAYPELADAAAVYLLSSGSLARATALGGSGMRREASVALARHRLSAADARVRTACATVSS